MFKFVSAIVSRVESIVVSCVDVSSVESIIDISSVESIIDVSCVDVSSADVSSVDVSSADISCVDVSCVESISDVSVVVSVIVPLDVMKYENYSFAFLLLFG